MPRTFGFTSGDGVNTALWDINISIPIAADAPGCTFEGSYQSPGGAMVTLSGAAVNPPAVPGSNSTFWFLQANITTGVISVKSQAGTTGSSNYPAVDAGNVNIVQQELKSTDVGAWNCATTFLGPF
jgi:hypothetical protein